MSENKEDKDKKPATDAGQTATTPTTTPPVEIATGEKKDINIKVTHEFVQKSTETSTENPPENPAEKPAETAKPAEKPTETAGTETSKEKELREKLEEREGQLATIALKEFEKQRDELLTTIKDEKKREYAKKFIGDDPDRLETIKGVMTTFFGVEPTTTQPAQKPEGQPEFTPDELAAQKLDKGQVGSAPDTTKSDIRKVIDMLYDTLADSTKSDAEKMKAQEMINELMGEALKGMKKSGNIRMEIMECPKCKSMIYGGWTCEACGYTIPSEQRSLYPRGGKKR